ncbi:MAG: anaerobic ribonucleoside-triphosphate reductase activating protein [Thermodesulfobacteriota bacterium]|nr:anaerobic ribonucleoside-triphosphate reductase activating protein [Thermodesulfobacteriota bacterium]
MIVLGGLQKNSFIDYPGKVSCVLFFSGCNFDCPYCHNPGLARGRTGGSWIHEQAVYDFLEKRKGFLDGVVISGGEPTLRQDIITLCRKIKEMGYPIKLDTNGSRPQVIKQLIDEGLIDYVAMDVKTAPYHYSPLFRKDSNPKDILSSIRTIMKSGLNYEFRTTCIKPIVDAPVIRNIAGTIEGAVLYALQRFRNGRVLHPEFFRGTDPHFREDELMDLKAAAASWVQRCIVR